MLWFGLALTAHVGNALVFIVDKSLLKSGGIISQPLRYAFWSGLLAVAAVVVLPFDWMRPTLFMVGWSVAAGVWHLAALWFFFTALKEGEPSRVVPIAGSAVPLFTLVLAVTALGEVLAMRQLAAVIVLIAGGALLSVRIGDTLGLSKKVVLMTVISGAFFAAYFVTVKYLYDGSDTFLAVFGYSRIIEGLLALVLLGPLVWRQGRKYPAPAVERGSRKKGRSRLVGSVFVGNKVLAAGAFLLQGYAIKLGSVTVVNSLQGVQYLFLLIMAIIVSRKWPNLWREELQRVSLAQKLTGIITISLGLMLLV